MKGEGVRVDKWLWSIRIFKSRTKSSDICKGGRVRINEKPAKPSSEVHIGDEVKVKKEGINLTLTVLKLIGKRVGAPIAVTCYENITPEEELNKFDSWYVGKAGNEMREKGSGRPTKRDRRALEGFKKGDFDSAQSPF